MNKIRSVGFGRESAEGQRGRKGGLTTDMNDERPGRLRGSRKRAEGIVSQTKGHVSIPSFYLGNRKVGRFMPKGGLGNKPNRPKVRCSKQIQEFRPKQTQDGYLPCNLWVTVKISPIFRKFECRTPLRIADILRAANGLQRKIGALFREFECERFTKHSHLR